MNIQRFLAALPAVTVSIVICAMTAMSQDQPPGDASKFTDINGVKTANVQYGGIICSSGNLDANRRCMGGNWASASSVAAAYAKGVYDRLADTNAMLQAVVEATRANTAAANASRDALDRMATQMGEGIQQVIARRFDTLPAELLSDPVVKERLKRLQEEITRDVKEALTKPPAPTPTPVASPSN